MHFVVLHHTGIDSPHFDLMFETAPGALLTTWRCACWPIEAPIGITRIGDHRRDYLSYEGALSNDRGTAKRIAKGTCDIDRQDDDSFWTINFADQSMPLLHLKKVTGDQWLALPCCGG